MTPRRQIVTIPVMFEVCLEPGKEPTVMLTQEAAGYATLIIGAAAHQMPLVVAPHHYIPLVARAIKAAEDSTRDIVVLDRFGAVEEEAK